jgi:hypothetical protein
MYEDSGGLTLLRSLSGGMQNLDKTFSVSKQTAEKLNRERFNLRKLKDLEVKKQYQV